MITYQESLDGIRPDQLRGFFAGWPSRPSAADHLAVLAGSDYVVLAIDEATGDVVGFITALSDGVLCAYISFLEVVPGYRRRGIGSQLARRMLEQLRHLYAVDLLCDPALQPFYAQLGMTPAMGMRIRRPERTTTGRAGPVSDAPLPSPGA